MISMRAHICDICDWCADFAEIHPFIILYRDTKGGESVK